MKYLQFLVIFMGILIIAGVAFLLYSVSTGLHKKKRITPETALNTTISRQTFGDHTVSLPDNQTVLEIKLENDHFIVHLQDTQTREQQWWVIDLLTGQKLGSLRFSPQ